MKVEPGASDEGEDGMGIAPPSFQDRIDGLPEVFDGIEDPVADLVLDEVP